jgi:hypothetical protein
MKCTLARLVNTFEFTLQQPADSVTYVNSLTLPIKGTPLSSALASLTLLKCVLIDAQAGYKWPQS